MSRLVIMTRLNQEDASNVFQQVSDFFTENKRRAVCRTDLFPIRKKHIAEDILRHSMPGVVLAGQTAK